MVENKNKNKSKTAFTLIEVVIVMVVIGIIAAIAVPMYSSAATTQLRAAADIIATDLEYAKSMAITTGQDYQVVFNPAAESYSIKNYSGTVINHPVKIGQSYSVDFSADGRLSKVNIVSTNFGAANTIKFNYLGSPDVSDGRINLNAEGNTMTVKIESATGYVSIE